MIRALCRALGFCYPGLAAAQRQFLAPDEVACPASTLTHQGVRCAELHQRVEQGPMLRHVIQHISSCDDVWPAAGLRAKWAGRYRAMGKGGRSGWHDKASTQSTLMTDACTVRTTAQHARTLGSSDSCLQFLINVEQQGGSRQCLLPRAPC